MNVQLMHIIQYPSSVVGTLNGFKALSQWLDDQIRGDATLDAATRAEPATVNLLHNVLIDDAPTPIDANAAQRFAGLVECLAETSEDRVTATAARELAEGIRRLAEEHDELSLRLVQG